MTTQPDPDGKAAAIKAASDLATADISLPRFILSNLTIWAIAASDAPRSRAPRSLLAAGAVTLLLIGVRWVAGGGPT